jgi:hypothetical protein
LSNVNRNVILCSFSAKPGGRRSKKQWRFSELTPLRVYPTGNSDDIIKL